MTTPEMNSLVDALIEAARDDTFVVGPDGTLLQPVIKADRAALLAAIVGDAVPVAWVYTEFHSDRPATSCVVFSEPQAPPYPMRCEIKALYDRPPTPSAIAEGALAAWRDARQAIFDVPPGQPMAHLWPALGKAENDLMALACTLSGPSKPA